MCTVSDKLRLCTCAAPNPENLKHYWVFYRRDKNKDLIIIGEPMLPVEMDAECQAADYETLHRLLNAGNPFDVALQPKRSDRLLLAFRFPEQSSPAYYGFRYDGHQWTRFDFDPFEWVRRHEEASFGKIIHALKG